MVTSLCNGSRRGRHVVTPLNRRPGAARSGMVRTREEHETGKNSEKPESAQSKGRHTTRPCHGDLPLPGTTLSHVHRLGDAFGQGTVGPLEAHRPDVDLARGVGTLEQVFAGVARARLGRDH